MKTKNELTINDAIIYAIRSVDKPLLPQEAYDYIVAHDLYQFHAQNPAGVVRSQIRKHCKGLNFPSAASTKYFSMGTDGRFGLLENPVKTRRQKSAAKSGPGYLQQLKELHKEHTDTLKHQILKELKRLSPDGFELFSKKLLDAYGFENMKVTQSSNDGGIDGNGALKVGIAYMNIAFQSKRWKSNVIHRPEIDKFRGAIQGKYEQGIFFTTSKFSKGAQAASFQSGAVPIIMIDGDGIVDLMIEKSFGVEQEFLPVYSSALDIILSDDDYS